MPQTPHIEQHFTASEAGRDIVIGMSDGLTVPFALLVSVAVTLLALLVFGYIKGHFTGVSPLRSGVQTMLIGGVAAAAAFAIARAIS